MYRVLIAEDEKLVRIGLKSSIDWGKYGMAVIADEPDGLSALNTYEREKPDVIITDIKMPGMSGMELISKIRENDKDTKIIILTCLEEFDLVRSAMQLNVSGYIIKVTMTDEEIEAVLKKVQEELNARQNTRMESRTIQSSFKLIKDKVLKDFLFFQQSTEEEFAGQLAELKIKLKPDRLLVCVMEIDHFHKLKARLEDEHGELIRNSIDSLIDEILDCKGEAFNCNAGKYLLIFNIDNSNSENKLYGNVFPVLDKIRKSMEKFFNISVSFGVSTAKSGFDSLKQLFEQADKALEKKFYNGPGIFFSMDGFSKEGVLAEKASALYDLPDLLWKSDNSFKKQFKTKVTAMLQDLPDSKICLQEAFCELLQWLATLLQASDSISTGLVVSGTRAIQECETFDEMLSCIIDVSSRLKMTIKRGHALSDEISQATGYIEANYEKNISLQQVAAHVHLSATYLSALFKKELQINFVNYVNEMRMEKAKELLLKTCLKSFEVAEKVGFKDNTYFSKAFKRHYGIGPGEYRKRWIKNWVEDSYDPKEGQE